MAHAILNEVYATYQGEGPYVGQPQIFVRFQGCSQRCQWCDTLATLAFKNPSFRIEKTGCSMDFESHPNPISPENLTSLMGRFPEKFISLTGGEPLEQVTFLKEWLPMISSDYKILLETAGLHPASLEKIIDWIDVVSMDIKIPSSTKESPRWEDHATFLKIGSKKEIYIKCVVTEDTQEDELQKMMDMISEGHAQVPLYLQPASKTQTFDKIPSSDTIIRQMSLIHQRLPQTSFLPQMHKTLGVL